MPAKSKTVDAYLAAQSPERRAALQKLRQTIQAAAPKAQERISYGIPCFYQGRMLVGYGAAAKHYAIYALSRAIAKTYLEELKGYDMSTGTIRFPWNKPLPVAIVRKIVKARLAENAAKDAAKTKGKARSSTSPKRKRGTKA